MPSDPSLKEFRKRYRLAQGEAAALFDVAAGSWSKWERGRPVTVMYVSGNVKILLDENIDDDLADQLPQKIYTLGGAGTLRWLWVELYKRSKKKKDRPKEVPLNENPAAGSTSTPGQSPDPPTFQ
jgi:hypothetical protein